ASSKLRPTHTQTPAADGRAVTAGGGRAPGAAEAKAARRPGMGPRPPRRQAAGRHAETVASEPIGDDLVEHDSEATANEPGDAPSDIQADADERNEPETGGPPGGARNEAATRDDHAGVHPHANASDEQNLIEVATSGLSDHKITSEHDESPVDAGETAAHAGHEGTGGIAGAELEAGEAARDDEDGSGQSELVEGEE